MVTPINYIELPVTDMAVAKKFYSEAFGWTYEDYGPEYAAFTNAGIDGGFDATKEKTPSRNGALVVLFEKDLNACLTRVEDAGGEIVKPIFEFPGGKRFQFMDPCGNGLAVWSDDIAG